MATFGKRDLGLALSDKMEDNDLTLVADETADDVSKKVVNPKLDPTRRVQRLRPNKMPSWFGGEENEVEMDEDDEGGVSRRKTEAEELEEEYVPTQQAMKEDRRLQRLEQARRMTQEERTGRRRFEAEVIEADEEEEEEEDDFVPGDVPAPAREWDDEEEEDDEEAIARRRAAIRQRLQQRRAEEEEEAKKPVGEEEEEDEEEDEDEESEYETDSDESDAGPLALLKPVFIPKHKRELNKEIEKEEQEEEEKYRKQQLALEQRKRETKNIVAEQIRLETQGVDMTDEGYGSEAGAPDDEDKPEDDALEFEGWKVRELFRVKRDRDARLAREREKAEVERRRNMTDAERAAEDARLGLHKEKPKAKWKFMQKYYHKGAFYMDDESIREASDVRKREADAPTGEDKFNKEALPKVMQVKAGKFGRAGQTKWTHLLNEDTTQAEVPSLWTQVEKEQELNYIRGPQNKWTHQLAGTGDIDSAGRRKPKK